MIITLIPAVFAVLGILLYVLATNPKVQEIGRLVFFAGFLVCMFVLARETVHLFKAELDLPPFDALRSII